jgi:N-succinyl-L-ornithine transcarbamylase
MKSDPKPLHHFTSVQDVPQLEEWVQLALKMKHQPLAHQATGMGKTLGLIFLNPSLRTRISTQKAASQLGMSAIVMNVDKEGWALEMEDGVVMNSSSVEHVKEAAAVMGRYFDILAIRSFPGLKNREEDYAEAILQKFIQYSGIPVLSLESATRHPLQSFADLLTIREHSAPQARPKVVLTWAPHIKALPQAVPNSFAEWMLAADMDLTIVQPKGYELSEEFTRGAHILYHQEDALRDADFIYVKNWSSYADYGQMPPVEGDWLLTEKRLRVAPKAKIMHCLPVRRGLELSDELLDGPRSLVVEQAANRVPAAQAALYHLLTQAL